MGTFSFLQNVYLGNTLEIWLIAIGTVALSYLIGKAVYWFFGNIVKQLTKKTKTKLDDIIIDMIEEPIMMGIIIFGIWYASKLLTYTSPGVEKFMGALIGVLIVVCIAWLITRLFDSLVKEYLEPMIEKSENDLDDQILPIVKKVVKITVWIIAIIIALDNAGYNIATLLAGLGIGGLLIAMAAKDTVSNIFGGITIFADKPFKIKDRVKILGFDGFITEIGIRSTRMQTLDGTEVTIPNSTFSLNAIENVSREPSRKVLMTIGLTYDTSPEKMEKAIELLHEISKKNKKHLAQDSLASFTSFGDFSLGILFIYWIHKDSDILGTMNLMNMDILKEFNKHKLDFAFPTQTIELKK